MTRKLLVLLSVIFLTGGAAFAAETNVALTADGARETTHSSRHPLLLFVNASARGGANASMQNAQKRREMQLFSRTEAFAKLTDKEKQALYKANPIVEEPKSSASLASAKITMKNADGKEVRVKIRPLKAGPYHYGIDAAELAKLPEGIYTLEARVGNGVSETVTVRLTAADTPADPQEKPKDRALYLAGTYHVLDHNWAEAGKIADLMISRNADSVEGWTLKGDALKGLKDYTKALEAYFKALELANNTKNKTGKDGPRYLARKIHETLTELHP